MADKLLSVIVPVYNEESVIQEFIRRVKVVLEKLNYQYELLFVNDGSQDRTLLLLQEVRKKDFHIKIVNLSRNFGSQAAISAGLDKVCGDVVVIIDADLQDPPEVIPQMIKKWEQGFEVVYGRRKRRLGETIFKRYTAMFFYRIVKAISNVEIPVDAGDFRLMGRKAVDVMKQLRETHRYVRGLVAWIGFKQACVEYIRDKRYAGKTKYGFFKMAKLSWDGISSFSILPLKLAGILGITSVFFSFSYIAYACYVKYVLHMAVQGWTSIVVAIFFIGGVQLLCINILGDYVGILHNEAKRRPLYVISEIYDGEGPL